MEESIQKRIWAARHGRLPPWHNSVLLHAIDIFKHSDSNLPFMALIVLENFDVMLKDIRRAPEDETFHNKWTQREISFFLWDGHDEKRGKSCGDKFLYPFKPA